MNRSVSVRLDGGFLPVNLQLNVGEDVRNLKSFFASYSFLYINKAITTI